MRKRSRLAPITATCCALLASAACTINPVTGERQLALISAEDEVAIGSGQYLPSQQMQGGEYRRDPALSQYVRDVGSRLAAVSDRALPYEFVIINSSVPNAWALPGGKIAVNRGLLVELGSEAELAAVIGHEIVHAAARHGAQAMQRGMLLQGAVLIASAATRDRDYSGLAVGAAGLGAQLINMRHGREAELEADVYGMRYMSRAGYDPRAAVELQQTFVRLSQNRDDRGWLAGLFASHPPSAERVDANRATAQTLPAAGTLGRDAYARATASLRRDLPGYEALDRASEALAAGDPELARREATSAAELLRDEAQAEALLGDIEMAANRPGRALGHYDQALSLNDRFFYYQLAKGHAHLAFEQIGAAETAYRASLALLPTADAYLGLGRIAERRGDRNTAIQEYSRAAESEGAAGAEARRALVRLDLPENPERYLALASTLDSGGLLVVRIENRTEFEVGSIQLVVGYIEGDRARLARRLLEGTLAPGATRTHATSLGPFAPGTGYEVSIERAEVIERQ
ncbi:MAG TPA: M48 family metalloprotease [Gammaproteobacteria bacterium]|jgi:predicted Zn-dependent protease